MAPGPVRAIARLQAGLARRRAAHLYRRPPVVEGVDGSELIIDGQRLLAFCSNDYLGLSRHPAVIAALQGQATRGVGAGAAHLISGHYRAHQQLEEELAAFTGFPRALLFSTGYMANLGVISTLCGPGDGVFEDRLNHASLLDGALLSRARLQRYAHGDIEALQQKLERFAKRHPQQERLVASDGVFSMDGDLAPLSGLAQHAAAHQAWLLVDDAHGLGVLGAQGRGSLEACNLLPDAVAAAGTVLVGTLGKALGTFGAFVAADEVVIETLIQQARPYIYTTATPPALAAATRASLHVVRSAEGAALRRYLHDLVQYFRQSAAQLDLPLADSFTPIQPLLLGSAEAAMAAAAALRQRGLLVSAIRPPTVPEGSARLRITLSALHTRAQVDRLLETLRETLAC